MDIKKTPWQIGERTAVSLDFTPLYFVPYCEMGLEVGAQAKSQDEVNKLLFRARIKNHVVARDNKDAPIPLDDASIVRMPIKLALAIKAEFTKMDAVKGEGECSKVGKGDGMSSPIHIVLGSPIIGANDTIPELEFMAKTLGDLEDLISADDPLRQAIALLKIARPVGSEGKFQALPDWALRQISLQDGFWIMNKVVPSFTA